MNTGQIVSSIIGGVAVLLLGAIGRMILGIRSDFRRFLKEHLWLLATTLWTKDKVLLIMQRLDMSIDNPPPDDLPK